MGHSRRLYEHRPPRLADLGTRILALPYERTYSPNRMHRKYVCDIGRSTKVSYDNCMSIGVHVEKARRLFSVNEENVVESWFSSGPRTTA